MNVDQSPSVTIIATLGAKKERRALFFIINTLLLTTNTATKTFFKLVDSTACIHNFLFAGIEGMAR
jgi:hypothetical protein